MNIRVVVSEYRLIQWVLHSLADGLIDGITDARLKSAVDVSELKGPFGGISEWIDVRVHDEFAFRQRSRFIAAEHIDAAEVLHRCEILHDHFSARHMHRPVS